MHNSSDNTMLEQSSVIIGQQQYLGRLDILRSNMSAADIDAVILVAGVNMRYYTGLSWALTERMVSAVVTQQQLVFICPGFEESAMRAGLNVEGDWLFWQEHENPAEALAGLLKSHNINRVAVDPKCPLWLYEKLQSQCSAVNSVSAVDLIGCQRAIKSADELALINHAMQITLKVHKLTYDFLQPGKKASEIIRFIDEAHRQLGADNGSYFCAVQFDEGTSHPHGVPGDSVLKDNTLVLVDTGCQINGYHSDITRTYSFGAVSNKIRDIWAIEKEAQQAAFDAVRPGVACESIDYAAREVILKYGLGPDYKLPGVPHRTGHGIGLEIHEGPYLVRGDKTLLQAGMCFSNEPMIVVPDEFGVRLEDHFYVTEAGASWFTEPQHSLDNPFSK